MSIRRLLIPAVAGLMLSPALMAADLDLGTGTTLFSSEYLSTASSTDSIPGDVVIVRLGVEYSETDRLSFAFTGAALDEATVTDPVVIAATSAFSGLTMTVLNATESLVSYRITAITLPTGGSTVNVTNGLDVLVAAASSLRFDAATVGAADEERLCLRTSASVSIGSSIPRLF